VSENIRAIIRWLSSVHAPLGHWAPLAGAGLLTCAHLFHSVFLKGLAYSGSAVFAILIASDIAQSFIDPHAFPDRKRNRAPVSFPMQAVRVVLSVALGSLYSFLIFVGIGLWMPLIFLPVIFLACCFIAWRNVSLWYQQGEEFEESLGDAEHKKNKALPKIPGLHAQ
jgi:4-hydroxybenzoate polyprenyltransferase